MHRLTQVCNTIEVSTKLPKVLATLILKYRGIDVTHIISTDRAFAALREDGRVVAWGDPKYGGDDNKVRNRLENVQTIYSNPCAFAALRTDGDVVTWWDPVWEIFYGRIIYKSGKKLYRIWAIL